MVLLAAVLIAPAADAEPAESTCTLHPQHARLEITLYGYPNVLERSGDDLLLNGSTCDSATVHNTDLIDVTALPSNAALVAFQIDMGQGMFEPGATIGSLIPIGIDFTHVQVTSLWIVTRAGGQHITIDGRNVDLDADRRGFEPDIVVSDLDDCGPDCRGGIKLSTGSGQDHIVQRHTEARSYPIINTDAGGDMVRVDDALVISGGGDDVLRTRHGGSLLGQDGDDVLIGGSEGENLDGFDGNDRIYGGRGPDSIYGGDGRDIIVGGNGQDFIDGEGYGDWIWGGRGLDEFDGGDGHDRCQPNHGDNLHGTDCEHRLSVPPPAP